MSLGVAQKKGNQIRKKSEGHSHPEENERWPVDMVEANGQTVAFLGQLERRAGRPHRVDFVRKGTTGSVKVHPLFKVVSGAGRRSHPALRTPLWPNVLAEDPYICSENGWQHLALGTNRYWFTLISMFWRAESGETSVKWRGEFKAIYWLQKGG